MDIIITIRILEEEYKQWDEYQHHDMDGLKKTLKNDFTEATEKMGIWRTEIEVKTED